MCQRSPSEQVKGALRQKDRQQAVRVSEIERRAPTVRDQVANGGEHAAIGEGIGVEAEVERKPNDCEQDKLGAE
jgi:hypothetical protein